MLRYLLEKEFRQIVRDRAMLVLIMAYPIVTLLVMPWATTMEIRQVKMAVEDHDQTDYSRRLVQKMVASDYFLLSTMVSDQAQAADVIARGEADMILTIPPDWSKSLLSGFPATQLVSINTIQASKGALASAYATAIIQDFSDDLRSDHGIRLADKVRIDEQYLYNPHRHYRHFIVPGLICVLLTLLSCFLPAMSVINEKERGTIEQINVTPIRTTTFVLAKVIPYWIIGLLMFGVGLLIEGLVYGIWPVGGLSSVLGAYLFTALYIVTCSGIGLLIANGSSTLQQTMFLIFFTMIIFMLMSGLFTPIGGMPAWAQALSQALPMTHLIKVLRALILKGSSVILLSSELLWLVGFASVSLGAAVLTYRKRS